MQKEHQIATVVRQLYMHMLDLKPLQQQTGVEAAEQGACYEVQDGQANTAATGELDHSQAAAAAPVELQLAAPGEGNSAAVVAAAPSEGAGAATSTESSGIGCGSAGVCMSMLQWTQLMDRLRRCQKMVQG